MQKFLLSSILFFLILLTFGLFFFFYETRFFGSRASVSGIVVSTSNSYLFSTPTESPANGQNKTVVTAFILDENGKGVYGRQVVPSVDSHVTLVDSQATTDTLGKATFTYTSTVPGQYYLQVSVDGSVLPQKLQLTFTQP